MDPSGCLALSTRTDFTAYIDLLRNATGGDFSLVKDCKTNVCGALWGSGNPDISGIGMAIGYILESFICACLVAISMWFERSAKGHPIIGRLLVANATTTFFDNAIFFTFAIQTASIVTLSGVDFGVNAVGMGGFTVEIAWLVSSLTLLPLLPMVLRPKMFLEGGATYAARRRSSSGTDISQDGYEEPGSGADGQSGSLSDARRGQRFFLFVICWAMGFCPFFSRMGGTFGEWRHYVKEHCLTNAGESRIGSSPNTAITFEEWSVIAGVCFEGVSTISSDERNLTTAFGILSYLLLSIVVISKILSSALEDKDHKQNWLTKCYSAFGGGIIGWYTRLGIDVVVVIALVVQFWAFFRLRQLQSVMIRAAGGSFPDGQWTFGQIVAIVVFVPVAAEVMFVWKRRSLYL